MDNVAQSGEAQAGSSKKTLGFFQIVMINIIAVDSLRTLPFAAEYGLALVFFYLIGGLMFFLPSALIAAELGTGWPQTGGLYIWIREAFGPKVALVAIWLNWIFNLAWYPTVMALIAGTSAYLINPAFAENKLYMSSIILGLFWIATYINCYGMKFSSLVSTIGATIGTIVPMTALIVFGIIWIATGHNSAVLFEWGEFLPQKEHFNKLAFFSNILFGLIGLEMVATHAQEMKNPYKDYPRALFVSLAIILTTIILSSLAMTVIIPKGELSLVTGTLQAFSIFFTDLGMPWGIPIIALCIIIGGLSGVAAWIIGPTKGIMVAARDGGISRIFTKTNRQGVPIFALLIQAVIVTILSLAFIFMPSINSSFWLLSVITAQLAMVVYIILFAAAIKLHHHKPHITRSFKVPGGMLGMWCVAGVGIFISFTAIVIGFIPPKNIEIGSTFFYESILVGGIVILSSVPLLFHRWKKKKAIA